jgi:hypothetical protein
MAVRARANHMASHDWIASWPCVHEWITHGLARVNHMTSHEWIAWCFRDNGTNDVAAWCYVISNMNSNGGQIKIKTISSQASALVVTWRLFRPQTPGDEAMAISSWSIPCGWLLQCHVIFLLHITCVNRLNIWLFKERQYWPYSHGKSRLEEFQISRGVANANTNANTPCQISMFLSKFNHVPQFQSRFCQRIKRVFKRYDWKAPRDQVH